MARTKLMDCGHGSRHLSPYDGRCRRCVRDAVNDGGTVQDVAPTVPATKTKVHEHDA